MYLQIIRNVYRPDVKYDIRDMAEARDMARGYKALAGSVLLRVWRECTDNVTGVRFARAYIVADGVVTETDSPRIPQRFFYENAD